MAGVAALSACPLSCAPRRRSIPPSVTPQGRNLNCDFCRFPSLAPALLRLAHHSGRARSLSAPRASAGSAEYVVEPGTGVKFPKELQVPGSSSSLVLLGTGYREKVFAIIGVKVYAAGFYAESAIKDSLNNWKAKPSNELANDSSLFSSIFHSPSEKSLNILLVRDVDGKTFWNALNDVISPRITNPMGEDEFALSTFQNTFQGRALRQGTSLFLTWVKPSKMLVSISSTRLPTNVDAEINSVNVNLALYDGFFGSKPVSPTLKASIADGLAMLLY